MMTSKSSVCEMEIDALYPAASRPSSFASQRKRLRFSNHPAEETDTSVEVLTTIRASSSMSPSEIDALWYSKLILQQNLESARRVAMEGQSRQQGYQHDQCKEVDYAAAIESSYVACCLDQMEDSPLPQQCAGYLSLASRSRTYRFSDDDSACLRGLEKLVVPMLGVEASRRRKEAIAHVVLAQHALKEVPCLQNRLELLREISVSESRPARKFAEALGAADTMSALHTYQELQDPSSQGQVRVAALVA